MGPALSRGPFSHAWDCSATVATGKAGSQPFPVTSTVYGRLQRVHVGRDRTDLIVAQQRSTHRWHRSRVLFRVRYPIGDPRNDRCVGPIDVHPSRISQVGSERCSGGARSVTSEAITRAAEDQAPVIHDGLPRRRAGANRGPCGGARPRCGTGIGLSAAAHHRHVAGHHPARRRRPTSALVAEVSLRPASRRPEHAPVTSITITRSTAAVWLSATTTPHGRAAETIPAGAGEAHDAGKPTFRGGAQVLRN